VSGRNVVLTGPAADEAELEALAAAGVLRMRQVLLEAPSPGGRAYGDAKLVQPRVLALFNKLACGPGGSDRAWQRQIGYTASSDWDNPDAQTVSYDSFGHKFALADAEVLGQDVTSAAAMPAASNNQWTVDLTFNIAGTSAFAGLTTDLHSKYAPSGTGAPVNDNDLILDQVAVVLDGLVISTPDVDAPITGGQAPIPGLTRAQAQEVAAELQSGPLPVTFQVTGASTHPPSASGQAPAS
jgi:hypothetical protein